MCAHLDKNYEIKKKFSVVCSTSCYGNKLANPKFALDKEGNKVNMNTEEENLNCYQKRSGAEREMSKP